MRFNFNKYLAIAVTFLCVSNVSIAGSVVTCATAGSYDFGDAKGYAQACHDTNNWQQLGKAKINDGNGNVTVGLEGDSKTNDALSKNKGWNAETSQKKKDSGDNGVQWRIKDENGDWSKWGKQELAQGQSVEFKFVVTRSSEGNHEFDQLKAWNDWNANGVFEESESIIDEKWYKNEDHGKNNRLKDSNGDWITASYNKDLKKNNSLDTLAIFKVAMQVPLDAVIGNTWMRARVICENSLTASDKANNIFRATGYYHQGEVEDNKVAINPVPEPTTLLVFGSALIGLALSRKKTK